PSYCPIAHERKLTAAGTTSGWFSFLITQSGSNAREDGMNMKCIGTIVLAAMTIAAASAQDTVHDRKENQQDRIAQGVKSGQLTAGETANLEKKEAAINQEVHADRSLNGGQLTNGEKRVINRQQNRLSNQIYNQKHDASTQHYGNNEVDARRE